MMRAFRADLHVHTCLSPCADLTMGPRTIVARASERALDMIGISDHNSAENAGAVLRAAGAHRLRVLPGLEVASREEVHILALFDTLEGALALQEIVYRELPGTNDPEMFGLQVVVNEDHDVLGFNPRLLAGATRLSVEQIVDAVHRLEGIAIAAHADREAFGILGQLGFLPEELELDALELSPHITAEEARRRWPQCEGRALVRFSDAHTAEQIGRATTWFRLCAPQVAELKKAFRQLDGRGLLPGSPSVGAASERCH